MRELNFRAWDKFNGLYYYSDKCDDLAEFFLECRMVIEGENVLVYEQSVGLKDKNGNGIYEGDILKDDVGELFEIKFGELPLDKSGDCVCTYQSFYAKGYGKLGKSPMYECNRIGNWMEIIGNIHQSSELLL